MKEITKISELPTLLTVPHIQAILGIGRLAAYELANRSAFPSFRVGKLIRIPRDTFFQWLEDEAARGIHGQES